MVDLVNFQKFSMDPKSWRATFGAGTLLGDLTDRLYKNGKRAIAHGTCPQVRSFLGLQHHPLIRLKKTRSVPEVD